MVIAHDFMETYGGAERVTEAMAAAFPQAPVYAIAGRRSVARRMGVDDRFHSLLAPRPRLLEHYRLAAPAFPLLRWARRLPEADVLLTSSYAFAHHLRTAYDAPQVCYCHSPLRFAWSMTASYRDRLAADPARGAAFRLLAAGMRAADRRAARSVTRYLTQSPFTAEQIERFYGRRADVIGVPLDTERFAPADGQPEDFWLFCGRLTEPYKRIGITVEAFGRLGLPLVVAGGGPALARLRETAPPNVRLLGHLADDELVPLMQRCRAAIFPSRDDFGLIPLEVMACGRPVLAFGEGGALHTMVPGVTGELFAEQSAGAIAAAVRAFDPARYDSAAVRAHAERWSSARFRERLVAAVRETARIS